MTAAYPLTWPDNIPRSKAREKGQFKTPLTGALNNVSGSIQAFARDSGKAVSGLVMSSNVTLGMMRPEDPGVAVWFTWDGMKVCIPVDRYQTVESNLQAIHHIIEARRTELRHGTLALVRATFTGFLALPPAGKRKRSWREVLGYAPEQTPSKTSLDAAYRNAAKRAHPDTGGSEAAMAELNQARADALEEIGA